MDSGIKLSPDALAAVQEMESTSKTATKLAFVIFRIGCLEGKKNETVNVAERVEVSQAEEEFAAAKEAGAKMADEEHASWYTFRTHIMEYDICHGAAFLEYRSKDGCERKKLVFVYFNRNDKASSKLNMIYSSTKLFEKFTSGATKIQASEADDLSFKEIADGVFKLK